MRIGELARQARCEVATIRYYERSGLMWGAPRTANNYRWYGPEDTRRLVFIRHCRSLGMGLPGIRALLALRDAPSASCGEANRILDAHLCEVSARIAQLQRLEKQLMALRRKCPNAGTARRCAILTGLGKTASSA